MQKFTTLTGYAAPLLQANIDTDIIIPKDFLKTIERTGLGKNLFNDIRYAPDGSPEPGFVLNNAPFNKARILLTGTNFGCGSSREHAPWALLDFGISAVIAPSFADIFYNNCFKNGILPLTLPLDKIKQLADVADTQQITIDLVKQSIVCGNIVISFEIDPIRKKALLEGLDDIGLSLEKDDEIKNFEHSQKQKQPWL